MPVDEPSPKPVAEGDKVSRGDPTSWTEAIRAGWEEVDQRKAMGIVDGEPLLTTGLGVRAVKPFLRKRVSRMPTASGRLV